MTYITKKTPKLVAQILATKFGFVPDCLEHYYLANQLAKFQGNTGGFLQD